MIGTNLNGVFYCCHAAIPHFAGAAAAGSSTSAAWPARTPLRRCCLLRVEGGPEPFSEALMQEVRHDDIRVSCVMPGSVATDFGRGIVREERRGSSRPKTSRRCDGLLHAGPQLPSRVELRPSKPPKK